MKIKSNWSKQDFAVVRALEVTPPGYEDVVHALKKKSNVDNPWAVAWGMKNNEGKRKEGMTSGAMPQLLRGQKKLKQACQSYQSSKDAPGNKPALGKKKK